MWFKIYIYHIKAKISLFERIMNHINIVLIKKENGNHRPEHHTSVKIGALFAFQPIKGSINTIFVKD